MLENALLTSSIAQAARDRGVEVQPAWAHGAKVFVDGLVEEKLDELFTQVEGQLCASQVFVYSKDRAQLFEDLSTLPYNIKKLKPGVGERVVPDSLDLVEVSSESSQDIDNNAKEVIEYQVYGTFIHFKTCADTRTIRSA